MQTSTTDEITIVTSRQECRECHYINEPGNQYCCHCGAPFGRVPEISGDPARAALSQASWRVHGIATKMVGRDSEFEVFKGKFQEIIDRSQLRAVLLTGAVGMGKSRLIHEFSQLVNTGYGNALLIASAWRDTNENAYAIVDRLLRNRFYIPERLAESEARERFFEGVRAIVKTPAAVEIAHRVGSLIGLPFPDSPYGADDPAEARREDSWRALAKLIRFDTKTNPLVIVLEDLQFASRESAAMIPFLAQKLADVPVLCVFSGSSDVFNRHTDLLDNLANLQQIDLRSLSDDDIRSIVDQVLNRAKEVPEVLYQQVCAKSTGNPLIAEEILRILMAEGVIDTSDVEWRVHEKSVAEIDVPSNVDDLIQASVEHLTDEERQLLEVAATIGSTFWLGPLTVVTRNLESPPDQDLPWKETTRGDDTTLERLRSLRDKDLIIEREESRYPDEVEYAFKHAAVRNLLVEQTSKEFRAKCHHWIAQWHELCQTLGIHGLDAVIAHHHTEAGNLIEAAHYYLSAGHKARQAYSNRRALEFFKKALDLFDDAYLLKRIDALHEIGSLYDLSGEYELAIPHLEEMARSAWRLGSLSKGGAAFNKLGRVYRSLSRHEETMSYFDRALNLFRRANDRVGIASTLDDIGKVHWIQGNQRAALEYYKEALERRRELGDLRSLALSLNHLGTVMVHQGDFKEALTYFRESHSLRKQIGDRRGIADSLNNLGVILAERGDLSAALRLWMEASEEAKAIGDRMLEGILLNNMGEVATSIGELEEADQYLVAAETICTEGAELRLLFDVTRNLGLLELKRGNATEALTHLQKAINQAKQLGSRFLEGIALRCLGEVHAHSIVDPSAPKGRVEEAEEAFKESVDILQDSGHEAELGRVLLAYGQFLIEQGLFEKAQERLELAKDIFERLGMKLLLQNAESLMLELKV